MMILLQSGMSRGDETFGSGGSFILAIILFIIVVLWQIIKFISWLGESEKKPAAVKNKIIFSEAGKQKFNDDIQLMLHDFKKSTEEHKRKLDEAFLKNEENH